MQICILQFITCCLPESVSSDQTSDPFLSRSGLFSVALFIISQFSVEVSEAQDPVDRM